MHASTTLLPRRRPARWLSASLSVSEPARPALSLAMAVSSRSSSLIATNDLRVAVLRAERETRAMGQGDGHEGRWIEEA